MSVLGKNLTVDVWFPFSKHEEQFELNDSTTYNELIHTLCEEEVDDFEDLDICLSIRREALGYDVFVSPKPLKSASKFDNNDEIYWTNIQPEDLISINRSIDPMSPRYHVSLLHKSVLRAYNMSVNSLFSLQLDKFLTAHICFRNVPNLIFHASAKNDDPLLLDGNGYYRTVYVAIVEHLIVHDNRDGFATICQLFSDCYDVYHKHKLANGGAIEEDEEEDVKEMLKVLLLASSKCRSYILLFCCFSVLLLFHCSLCFLLFCDRLGRVANHAGV